MHTVSLVIELIGGQSAHKGQRGDQAAAFEEIKPGVVHLPLGFILAGFIQKPVAVVSPNLSRQDVEACQFPIGSSLLQNQGKHSLSLWRIRIEQNHAILASREIIQIKDGAIGGLTALAKDATIKLGVRAGCAAIEQKNSLYSRLRGREVLLMIFDGALNPAKITCKAGDRVLAQRRRVSLRGHGEKALPGRGDGRPGSIIEVARRLTLRAGGDRREAESQQGNPQGRGEAAGQIHIELRLYFLEVERLGSSLRCFSLTQLRFSAWRNG